MEEELKNWTVEREERPLFDDVGMICQDQRRSPTAQEIRKIAHRIGEMDVGDVRPQAA
jgi:hypothetical protein